MPSCTRCGGQLERKDFSSCRDVELCTQCETTKLVRSKLYLNGKEVEFCVAVNTATGESTVLSREEE